MAEILDVPAYPRRLYIKIPWGDPVKQLLDERGFHYDGQLKAFWVGRPSKAACEKLVAEILERSPKGFVPPKVIEQPEDIRVTGKVAYKGHNYYMRARTEIEGRPRARVVSLDGKLDFWVWLAYPGEESETDGCSGSSVGKIVKLYEPRERRGYVEHTTLAGIQKFVERQRNPETRRGRCTECDAWGPVGEPCTECGGEGSYV